MLCVSIEKNIVLFHDNTRLHSASITQEQVLELSWSVLRHLIYSPDFASTDYYLFCSRQNALMEKNLSNEN